MSGATLAPVGGGGPIAGLEKTGPTLAPVGGGGPTLAPIGGGGPTLAVVGGGGPTLDLGGGRGLEAFLGDASGAGGVDKFPFEVIGGWDTFGGSVSIDLGLEAGRGWQTGGEATPEAGVLPLLDEGGAAAGWAGPGTGFVDPETAGDGTWGAATLGADVGSLIVKDLEKCPF